MFALDPIFLGDCMASKDSGISRNARTWYESCCIYKLAF